MDLVYLRFPILSHGIYFQIPYKTVNMEHGSQLPNSTNEKKIHRNVENENRLFVELVISFP